MLKVVVTGANGKMGQAILEVLKLHKYIMVVAIVSRVQLKLERTFPEMLYFKSLSDINIELDAVIDFTRPEISLTHLQICRERLWPLLIGTTGFTSEQITKIKNAAKNIPIILAPNTSLGMTILQKLTNLIAKVVPLAEIDILDVHHKHKQDAPSGSALMLGQTIQDAHLQVLHAASNAEAEAYTDDEKLPSINYSSIREYDVIGDHSVLFKLSGETIEIKHHAIHRQVFAEGALVAALWLHKKLPGLYTMQDVLGL